MPFVVNLNGLFQSDLISYQRSDAQIGKFFALVESNPADISHKCFYFIRDGLLLRKWSPGHEDVLHNSAEQIVLPKILVNNVLRLAQNIQAGGHLGVAKTKARFLA